MGAGRSGSGFPLLHYSIPQGPLAPPQFFLPSPSLLIQRRPNGAVWKVSAEGSRCPRAAIPTEGVWEMSNKPTHRCILNIAAWVVVGMLPVAGALSSVSPPASFRAAPQAVFTEAARLQVQIRAQ